MSIASVMIAAPQGRSGKTTISMGLCAALRKKGLKVKPFKKGPDYIDPSWLTAAAGHICGNLDPFMFSVTALKQSFTWGCENMDIAMIEASMGLYDSAGEDGTGSSAWLARLLKVPVILIVNASRMTRSAAAMVSGYVNFEPGTGIAGVILNNVAGQRHSSKLVTAIEKHCGIPVLGCVPSDARLALQERHIGIVPLIEHENAAGLINDACTVIEKNVDIDRVFCIANTAEAETVAAGALPNIFTSGIASEQSLRANVTIGVLYDRAFSFYYPDNLMALQNAGARLVFINSFTDSLPDTDGLYIGGGFPELYAAELEANAGLRRDIAGAAQQGLPVYAECAGLMYLCRAIIKNNRRYHMAGLFDEEAEIIAKPQGHGYMVVEVGKGNPFFQAGTVIRGHEFHYSRLTGNTASNTTFYVRRGHGIDGRTDGMVHKNTLATYLHLHALSMPNWAGDFVNLALSHRISAVNTAV
ncbi:MAG: hydrogenobyrinic acid a,c-diamide synthase (glutamine-hydrolyzing) [Dehalococcoidia bacterium]|nr:hydrogenobyrinic acid a,c-diamide synthase (glutamine-hydrolyzing) [Dehalococcoidia bacterium]